MVAFVAELLFGSGSVVPAGGVTEAVLVRRPTVPKGTVPVMVKVAWVPDGRFTSASMSPVPLVFRQVPAPLAEQVQVKPEIAEGKLSRTRAPPTSSGPLLVTTSV